MKNILMSLILLLGSRRGCGGEDEDPAPPPQRQTDPELDALKKGVLSRTQQLMDVPYEDWLGRFQTPESELSTQAAGATEKLIGGGYEPTSYEDYLSRLTPETSPMMTGALEKYQGLFDTETYGTEDYQQIEQDYLSTIMREFKEARGEAFDPIRERYIGENLYESGPGFQAEREYGEDTAQGVGDIATKFAYEGIQRKQEQLQYQDALKRGDYSTMYNLALSEEQRTMQPVLQATELAEAERKYQDALQRGDTETAFNMGQILRQNQVDPIAQATQAELAGLSGAQGLFGEMSQLELQEYQQDLSAWEAMAQLEAAQNAQGGGDLGGAGSMLGMAGGLGLAVATGGLSAPATLGYMGVGGMAGGGIGSMFKY